MLRFVLLTFLACCYAKPTTPADPQSTAQLIRSLPEPFRTDLALRWAAHSGHSFDDLFAQLPSPHLPLTPVFSTLRINESIPNQVAFASTATHLDRLSLTIRAVQSLQPHSPFEARALLSRFTDELASARWPIPNCQSHLVPIWSAYFDVIPSILTTGFTSEERATGAHLHLARRSIRLIRSVSQLHDALPLFTHPAITGDVRAAMLEELTARLSGWPVSSLEWWALYRPLFQRASQVPEIAPAFRDLVQSALSTPTCGFPTQAPPPYLEVLRLFDQSFTPLNVQPLVWGDKPEWQEIGPVDTPSLDDEQPDFLDEIRRLRAQAKRYSQTPQWRQSYLRLASQVTNWQPGNRHPRTFLALQLSALQAMVTIPDVQLDPEEFTPISHFLDVLTSPVALELQAQQPASWLYRLFGFLQTLPPAAQQSYDAAIARQTNPVLRAYAQAAKEGWL